MDYESLLNKVYEKIPKKSETADRFKVPPVEIEIVGPKSVFKNFSQIITVLRRDAVHLAKFLSRELAVPNSIQGNNLLFQGKVGKDILQKKLDNYIKEFVYCKECGEPDTKLVKEGKIIYMVCEACGAKHPMRSL
jgi:translation initiation factor 2 subunit 2